jgi:hypothetical protein
MNVRNLSDYQLYSLVQNGKLAPFIRVAAGQELEKRQLDPGELKALTTLHTSRNLPDNGKGLSILHKIILVVAPVFFIIQVIIIVRYLGLHQKKKWNDFLLYTAIGCLFWTFAIILFFRQPD